MKLHLKFYFFLFLFLTTALKSVSQSDSLVYYFNQTDPIENKGLGHFIEGIQLKDSAVFLKYGTKIHPIENRVRFYHFLGEHFYDLDDFSGAGYWYSRSLTLAHRTLNKKIIADALSSLGDMLRLQENNTMAFSYLFHAMYLYKELKDKKSLCNTLSMIGEINRCVEQYDDAIKYLNEALVIAKQNNYRNDEAFCWNSLGSTYQFKGEYQTAFHCYKKGEVIAQTIKDTMRMIDFKYAIADLLIEQKKPDEAFGYLKEGIELSEKTNNQYYLSFCYIGYSKAYLKQDKFRKSIEKGLIAFDIGKRLNALGLCADASEVLYKAYIGTNDYKNAFFYLKYTTDAYDSTNNSVKIKQQAQIESNFLTDYKEKQDSLIRTSQQKQKDFAHSAEIKQQKLVIYFIASGLILALTLTFFIFKGYKQKQKANEIITKQKDEVESQKKIVEEKNLIVLEKNKEILDSIHYAKHIQRAMLTSDSYLKKILPEHFVLYKPKDIVSGDFYWSVKHQNKTFLAVADCTGHGVPGAFMSLLGISFLNEIVIEKNIISPEKILNQLRDEIIRALNPEDAAEESMDGMDIVLCCYDFTAMELNFAAANNSLYLVRDEQLLEYKSDKFPVGKFQEIQTSFTLQSISLQKNDCIYTFTDGFADQFGGLRGKKYKYKQFKEQLLKNHHQPFEVQKKLTDLEIETWKGNLEQVDDVLLIGIKI
ncbi:MAG: tetratricopeptide repeat protein [Bacteroidota bacterium]|nr:tetratricopeptide repeat protein [Bacteroidota bacterium]